MMGVLGTRLFTFDAIFGSFLAKNDLLAIFFKNTLYETNQSNYLYFHTDNNDNIKMRHALDFLANTEKTIEEIGIEVGYNSTDHFSRSFKQYNHCSPSEFRKKIREHQKTPPQ